MMPSVPAMTDEDERVVATEEELLRTAPLPHERVIYWGSGSPQGTMPSLRIRVATHLLIVRLTWLIGC